MANELLLTTEDLSFLAGVDFEPSQELSSMDKSFGSWTPANGIVPDEEISPSLSVNAHIRKAFGLDRKDAPMSPTRSVRTTITNNTNNHNSDNNNDNDNNTSDNNNRKQRWSKRQVFNNMVATMLRMGEDMIARGEEMKAEAKVIREERLKENRDQANTAELAAANAARDELRRQCDSLREQLDTAGRKIKNLEAENRALQLQLAGVGPSATAQDFRTEILPPSADRFSRVSPTGVPVPTARRTSSSSRTTADSVKQRTGVVRRISLGPLESNVPERRRPSGSTAARTRSSQRELATDSQEAVRTAPRPAARVASRTVTKGLDAARAKPANQAEHTTAKRWPGNPVAGMVAARSASGGESVASRAKKYMCTYFLKRSARRCTTTATDAKNRRSVWR